MDLVVMELFDRGGQQMVSYDNGHLHGSWVFEFDQARRQGKFSIYFNARPDSRPVKPHVFVQIQETDVYRHVETTANWTVFLIPVKGG